MCREKKRLYAFAVRGLPVCRCPGCGLVSLHPRPTPAEAAAFDQRTGREEAGDPALHVLNTDTEREASRQYLEMLRKRGVRSGRLLLIAPAAHPFADEARAQGYDVARQVSVRVLRSAVFDGAKSVAVVVCHQLEKATGVDGFLEHVKAALRPGGVLLLTTPSAESWPRFFFGSRWTEWRPENLYYFEPVTIQGLC